MTRYATNIEHDGGCPDCDSYERKIDRMNAKMADLEAQLSAKEQECAKLKIDASHHAYNCDRAKQERDKAEAENDSLRAENERLKTTLVAGAELIKENWSKLCDDEGYGPQNLLLRMDGTLNTSGYPGYSSGEFEKLRKRCEDLEAENQQLKLKVVEDAVRFSMYMSGKSTIGDQDYFRRSFEAGYYKTWKIDN